MIVSNAVKLQTTEAENVYLHSKKKQKMWT